LTFAYWIEQNKPSQGNIKMQIYKVYFQLNLSVQEDLMILKEKQVKPELPIPNEQLGDILIR
jgi:hypothetical protein